MKCLFAKKTTVEKFPLTWSKVSDTNVKLFVLHTKPHFLLINVLCCIVIEFSLLKHNSIALIVNIRVSSDDKHF